MDFDNIKQKMDKTANQLNPVLEKILDGLLNDDAKFAQFDAEMRPVMEHDAQSFDFVVPSKRKNQVKRQFKALKEQDPKIYRDLKLFRTAIGLFSDNLFENGFVALVSKLSDPRKLANEGFGREHFYPLFMEILRFATMDMQMQSVLALIRKGASTYNPREVSDKHRIWMLRFEYAYITLRRASPLEPWLAKLSPDSEQTFKDSCDTAFGSTRLMSHPHEFDEFWDKVRDNQ